MARLPLRAFALAAYLLFLLCAALLFRFLATAPSPADASPLPSALAVLANAGLLLLFALPHSLLARPAVKRAMATRVPAEAGRSLYVLVASLTLIAMMWLWQPLPARLWSVDTEWLRHALWAGYGLGWLVLVAATFQLDHWGLFGLRQAFSRTGAAGAATLRTPWMYRQVRHPIMTGILLLSWATPEMSLDHALLAALFTLYVVVGTRHEERDLRRELGEAYRDYAERVPAFVPWLRIERWGWARRLAAMLALAMFLAGAWWFDADWREPPALPGRHEAIALEHDGRTRTALAYLPSRPDPFAAPIVVLHGTNGDGATARRMTAHRIDEIGERLGALVVYPDAHEGQWNDCRAAADHPARRLGIDDVSFLGALVDTLGARHGIASKRVFVVGLSNGAHLGFRWAIEAPARLAGLVSVAASLPTPTNMACTGSPARIPFFMVNGTDDPISPFGGGPVSLRGLLPRGDVQPVPATLSAFGLAPPEDLAAVAGDTVWQETPHGLGGYLILPGGGHTVPDSAHRFPRFYGATAARRIDADLLRFIEWNRTIGIRPAAGASGPAMLE